MKNLNALNEFRIDMFGDGVLGDWHNGAFIIPVKGEKYFVVASDGANWEHVSISHTNKHKMPSWSVMCAVNDMFFEDEEVVMQLHPKKSEYVNNVNNCLHLWRPMGKEIPMPPSILVGIK